MADKNNIGFDPQKLIQEVLEKAGVSPRHIIVPNVAIGKGDELKEMYTIGNIPKSYLNEEQAREQMQLGDQLYKVNIKRIE